MKALLTSKNFLIGVGFTLATEVVAYGITKIITKVRGSKSEAEDTTTTEENNETVKSA